MPTSEPAGPAPRCDVADANGEVVFVDAPRERQAKWVLAADAARR